MFKLFGKKDSGQTGDPAPEKLHKPKDILSPIGQKLVTAFQQDPDWVWQLKCVTKPVADADKKGVQDFRVFDPRETSKQGVAVKNFHSLDDHPQLVLYHGRADMKRNEVEIIDPRMEHKKAV